MAKHQETKIPVGYETLVALTVEKAYKTAESFIGNKHLIIKQNGFHCFSVVVDYFITS